jgi:hypothetical protein
MPSIESKEMLYFLLDEYITGKMNTENFNKNFVPIFNVDTNYLALSEEEYELFAKLSDIAGRSSNDKEDIDNRGFYSFNEVHKFAIKTKHALDKLFTK